MGRTENHCIFSRVGAWTRQFFKGGIGHRDHFIYIFGGGGALRPFYFFGGGGGGVGHRAHSIFWKEEEMFLYSLFTLPTISG